MRPVASVRNLSVSFGALAAVRGIDLDVHAGEVLGIVGESGSGKSVTALALAGLLSPTARVTGTIRVAETDVTTADAENVRRMRGRDLGFIFQDPTTSLNPVFPIGRQVIEGQVARGSVARAESGPRAVAALAEVEIADPAARAGQYPHQFSGGMRQRTMIAMAMAGQPKLIIADEPTTALDVTVQAQVLALLARRQAETGAAVILITHDLGVVAEMADRVAVMYAGRVVETAAVREIFARPKHPYTTALLNSLPRVDSSAHRLTPIPGQPPNPAALPAGCPFQPRCALGHGRAVCIAEEPALIEVGDGRRSACHFAGEVGLAARAPATGIETAVPKPRGATLLELENLCVHFPVRSKVLRRRIGWVRAVDGVSLVVHAGETLGLVGESGCGKTTTGRAVMGLLPATSGRIVFDGDDITNLGRDRMRPIRRHVQYVFQDPYASLNPVLPAGEIVAEPMRIHGVFEELGGEKRVAKLFDMVGLPAAAVHRMPQEFSGGQKQRIGIARALALSPKLLILDEPVASLDVSIQAQIVNLLQDLQRDLGLAYLFIAHDLSVVRHISDRVAVMYLGRVVEEADKRTLYQAPLHPYTQSLLSAVPVPDPAVRAVRRRIVLVGEIPSPARPPSGCTFHPRCFRASAICAEAVPRFLPQPNTGTSCACHHAGRLSERLPEPEEAAT
jgi:peptide/nickel transport system ATP-binding protein